MNAVKSFFLINDVKEQDNRIASYGDNRFLTFVRNDIITNLNIVGYDDKRGCYFVSFEIRDNLRCQHDRPIFGDI